MKKYIFCLFAVGLLLCGCIDEPASPPGPPAVIYWTAEELRADYPDRLFPAVTGGTFTDANPTDGKPYLSIRYELPTGEAFVFKLGHDFDGELAVDTPVAQTEYFTFYLLPKSADDVDSVTPYLLVTPEGEYIFLRLFDQTATMENYAQLITFE